jgi:hypothetical protein
MSDSEKLNRRRSRTPCLDENRVEDETGADNSKEIELSDISDEDEQWPESNQNNKSDEYTNGNNPNANGSGNDHQQQPRQYKGSPFKKITRSNRDRNYRDNAKRRGDFAENYSDFKQSRTDYRKIDNSRRKEIERYNVRKVVANREFTMSRSRSRSFSPRKSKPEKFVRRERESPRRDAHRKSTSPVVNRQKSRYSPISISPPSRASSPSLDRYRNKYRRSLSLEEVEVTGRQSRSRHKHSK